MNTFKCNDYNTLRMLIFCKFYKKEEKNNED